ncbi:MAG: Rrf2 family transcriptional regulator [Calditrichia bacterium]
MIKLSKKVEYALISIMHLEDSSPSEPISVRELVEDYKLPSELLGKILQKLVKHNIVESVQGVNGGYLLKTPLHEISLMDVISIVDGPIKFTKCSSRHDAFCSCKQLKTCNIKNAIYHIQKDLVSYFESMTLDKFYNYKLKQFA